MLLGGGNAGKDKFLLSGMMYGSAWPGELSAFLLGPSWYPEAFFFSHLPSAGSK